MIETKGLGAGSYPEPIEVETKTIPATIRVEYKIDTVVSEDWDKDRLREDINDNLSEYIDFATIEDYEIEV